MTPVAKPPWLEEQQDILQLLHAVLDKLDKKPASEWKSPPGFTIDEKLFPGLFVLGDAADQQWLLLKNMVDEFRIFSFHPVKKPSPYDPEYSRGRLRFNPDAEQLLRDWLVRPQQESGLRQWQRTVDEFVSEFPGDVQRLRSRPVTMPGKTGRQVVQMFVDVGQYQQQAVSLRQLSARCFQGQSKLLENRGGEELLLSLYPDLVILPKPVLVNVYLPQKIHAVLFIENEDTYIQATQGVPAFTRNMALVYCAGYKASAQRIRREDGVALYWQGDINRQHEFSAWWLKHAVQHWPVWFWGDLDFEGMGILKALKQRFGDVAAWQEGYQPMLESLDNGNGHGAGVAGKGIQSDPVETGCNYADKILLTAIRKNQAFVDQEFVF